MDMGKKKKVCLGRVELADYLQSLSEQLRRGQLETEGRQWTVPEEVWSEIRLKEKQGYIKAKMSFSWSTEPQYDQAALADLKKYRDSMTEVKKRLTASYKAISQMAKQGKFPDPKTLTEAMKIYLDHLASLQNAVEKQDFEAMLHELRDLENCKVDCHREFKSKG